MRMVYTLPKGSEGWTLESELQAVPSVGDTVHDQDDNAYRVRTVVFYPWGDPSATVQQPFVYVVLTDYLLVSA